MFWVLFKKVTWRQEFINGGIKKTMKEAIFTVVGFMTGGTMGVVLMCVLQINTINKYERKIRKLQRELEKSRNMHKNPN